MRKLETRIWVFQETIDEINTWTNYLHQSAERFGEVVKKYSPQVTEPRDKKLLSEMTEALHLLTKNSTLLNSRANRLRRPR